MEAGKASRRHLIASNTSLVSSNSSKSGASTNTGMSFWSDCKGILYIIYIDEMNDLPCKKFNCTNGLLARRASSSVCVLCLVSCHGLAYDDDMMVINHHHHHVMMRCVMFCDIFNWFRYLLRWLFFFHLFPLFLPSFPFSVFVGFDCSSRIFEIWLLRVVCCWSFVSCIRFLTIINDDDPTGKKR